jgi:hypothetical protein
VLEVLPDGAINEVTTVDSSTGYFDIAVRDNLAFAACGTYPDIFDGLRILDISTITAPSVVHSVELPTEARRISVDGDYAWLIRGNPLEDPELLYVVDISEPTSAFLVHTMEFEGTAKAVSVDDNLAYILTYDPDNFLIYDVSIPDSPELLHAISLSGMVIEGIHGITIELVNGYAIFGGKELNIVDIDPIADAHLVDSIDLGDSSVTSTYIRNNVLWCTTGYRILYMDLPW